MNFEKPRYYGGSCGGTGNGKQVLVVFNSRKDALSVVSMLGDRDDAFHLSTLLAQLIARRFYMK